MNKKIIKNLLLFKKNFREKRILKESAALTFTTLLGIIPFLIFIFFVIPQNPFSDLTLKLRESLINILLPKSIDKVLVYLNTFLASRRSYNIINIIFAMITAYSLFNTISDTFDNILNVHFKKRLNIYNKALKFFGTILFGSFFIAIIISSISVVYFKFLAKFSFLYIFSLYFIPFFLLFIALIFTYAFIPTINLRATSIIYTSIITSIIWVLVKVFFNFYIEYLTNVEVIYGFLASVPIFMLWVYLSWIIILSGVIVVSILEKLDSIPQNTQPKNTIRLIIEKDYENDTDIVYHEEMKKNELIENILRLIKDEE